MISLALDASASAGTVAILDGERLIAQAEAPMRGHDAEQLLPAVARALSEARTDIAAVGRVICGAGPGGFTSLRIAASIAKGIAVGRGVPLFSVSSLALIVAANAGTESGRRYLAAMDALRGEYFSQLVEVLGDDVRVHGEPAIIRDTELARTAGGTQAELVGPRHGEAWVPHARGATRLLRSIEREGPVNTGSWEPDYVRLPAAQAKWEEAHGQQLRA